MSNTKQNSPRTSVSFAAINQSLDINMISPVEKVISGKNMVEWGTRNAFPDYLLDLYNNVPTLRSIINGSVDFIGGDDCTILPLREGFDNGRMNMKGDTIAEQVRDLARDYEMYGGFALQILRDFTGRVSEIYYIDMRFLRCNEEGDVFYYCENWRKKGVKDCIEYPAFLPFLDWSKLTDEERARNASSILYVKNSHTQVYPAPVYSASIKACEIERLIDDFHISDLNNHFCSSVIINFNNGDPGDKIKEEISDCIQEKFAGASNGGRIMLSWNKNKESATTIQELKMEDFGERYKALSDHSRQQIFTAFRANPNLFGIPTEGNGFSNEEYAESYRLYNRTHVRPVQRMIADAYDKVYGQRGVLTIVPFSMEETSTEKQVN